MFSKEKRVTKDLFTLIMKEGQVIYGSFFMFKYIKHGGPKYAFVAPKNIAKKAIIRNSLRRRGYGALESLLLPSYIGVFIYKKEGLRAKSEEIKKDLDFILKKSCKIR